MKNNIEDLMKEVVEKITDYGYNDEYGYYSDWADGADTILKPFFLHAYTLGIQKALTVVEGVQIGWYDEGEGLDVEFSAQEMKDDVIKSLTHLKALLP